MRQEKNSRKMRRALEKGWIMREKGISKAADVLKQMWKGKSEDGGQEGVEIRDALLILMENIKG